MFYQMLFNCDANCLSDIQMTHFFTGTAVVKAENPDEVMKSLREAVARRL